jgi:lauroyl/myristoyl acyltransferase
MPEKTAVIDGYAASPLPHAAAESVPWISVKDLLWFLYYYPFRLLAARLPRSMLYCIAGPLFQLRFRPQRKRAVERMMAYPGAGITSDQAPRIARRCVSKLAASEMDNLLLADSSLDGRICCDGIRGLDHLERERAVGKGVLILTAHFYASRIAKRHLARLGYPVMTVRVEGSSTAMTSRIGRRILYPRYAEFMRRVFRDEVYAQQPDCALRILKRLRSGGLVNIHLDGRHLRKAVEWPFLGAPWRFPAGYLDLIRVSGCRVVPMLPTGNGAGLRIEFGKALEMTPADGPDEFAAANLPVLAGAVERQIQAHPEEWTKWIFRP